MAEVMGFLRAHPTLWNALKLALSAVLAIVVLAIALRLEKKLARRILAKNNKINLRFVESIIRFVMIMLAVSWVVMGSPLTEGFGKVLFQGTAIIGAIAGFAAQPVISDMICGLMISSTRPFEIGDRIELENGTAGIVKDITMRHVVIQTIDTLQLVIPNSKLNGMALTNMSYHTKTRSVHFRFNVGFDTDVELAKAVIRRAVQESPYSIPGKPGAEGSDYGAVYFIECGDSSLVMATTVYFEPTTPSEVVKSDINTRVKQALDANGIEIPYNYVSVVMRDGGKGWTIRGMKNEK